MTALSGVFLTDHKAVFKIQTRKKPGVIQGKRVRSLNADHLGSRIAKRRIEHRRAAQTNHGGGLTESQNLVLEA